MTTTRKKQIMNYFEKNVPEHLKYTCFDETLAMIEAGDLPVSWIDANGGENFKQVHRQLLKVGDLESRTWEGFEYLEKTIPDHFKTATYQAVVEEIAETPYKDRGFDNDEKLFGLRNILLQVGETEYRASVSKEFSWDAESNFLDETQFSVASGLEEQLKSDENFEIEELENSFSQVYANLSKVETKYEELSF